MSKIISFSLARARRAKSARSRRNVISEPVRINPETTALVIIDMQRDFLEKGGFGETCKIKLKGTLT